VSHQELQGWRFDLGGPAGSECAAEIMGGRVLDRFAFYKLPARGEDSPARFGVGDLVPFPLGGPVDGYSLSSLRDTQSESRAV